MKKDFLLNKNWKVFLHRRRQAPNHFTFPKDGIPAEVPGTIHTDLLNAGLIADPFFGMNEKDLQWIGWNDWRYETVFDLPKNFLRESPLWLIFEGLDTVADIFLNGRPVARTQNMFRMFRFEISGLAQEKNNHLRIIFASPLQWVKDHRFAIRQMPSVRHPDRVFLRKAQYSFGWDWGPMYPTSGIWRPVYLTRRAGGIWHVHFDMLGLENDHAAVQIECNFWGQVQEHWSAEFELNHKGQRFTGLLQRQGNKSVGRVEVPHPELWWPNGEGKPALHKLTVRLKDGQGQVTDERSQKVGLRIVELVTSEKGQPAFYFKINGRKVFVKGANWIPADSFLPRIKKETYRQLLTLAANANMNALRVWGGGIYEDDYFYELCDELGLMVWQDFMFACAAYPEEDVFVQEIQAELRENVGRLRGHPSVILWCGNNESEWIWHRDLGMTISEMPGYRLFHRHFPQWLKELDPFRPYRPTTPWGDDADPNNAKSGNRHAWEVWSRWQDYTTVKDDRSLFVTEFGFQAPANFYTFKEALPPEGLRVQSEAFEWHNKQDEGAQRLFRFLSGHLPVITNPEDFIYLTQLNQAFALQTCLEHWRMSGITNGAIIWQINDCWPVSSWSLIDSNLRPKLSYYQVRRSLAPFLIIFNQITDGLEILVKSDSQIAFEGQIEVVQLIEDDLQPKVIFKRNGLLVPGEKQTIFTMQNLTESIVLIASIYEKQGAVVARNVFHAKPWKYLRLPATSGKIMVVPKKEHALEVRSEVTAFFVELRHPVLNFSVQGFVLLPGERKIVEILNPKKEVDLEKIEILTLNRFLKG